MAFKKIILAALFCSVAMCAPAPQVLTQVHAVPHNGAAFHQAIPAALHTVRTVQGSPVAVHAVHNAAPVAIVQQQQPVAIVRTAAYAEPAVVRTAVVVEEEEEFVNSHPQYSYGYSVSDAVSGDSKTREESRDGDVVTGSYTVADPDGRIRRVVYTADKEHGFRATVTYDGEAGPVAIPFDAPVRSATVAAHGYSPAFVTAAAPQPQQQFVQVVSRQEQPAAPAVETKEVEEEEQESVAAVTGNANTVQVIRTIPAAAAAATTAFHGFHPALSSSAGHPGFVRVANGQALASTPFGLRAFPASQFANHGGFHGQFLNGGAFHPQFNGARFINNNGAAAFHPHQTRFINSNGQFVRAIPAGTQLVHHQ